MANGVFPPGDGVVAGGAGANVRWRIQNLAGIFAGAREAENLLCDQQSGGKNGDVQTSRCSVYRCDVPGEQPRGSRSLLRVSVQGQEHCGHSDRCATALSRCYSLDSTEHWSAAECG